MLWEFSDRRPAGLAERLKKKCERIEELMSMASVEGRSAVYQMGKAVRGTSLKEKKPEVLFSYFNLDKDLAP